ncbi:MAG: hypothetical protein ACOYUZ_04730 [Patescibacteria group bacterium]
MRFIKLMTVLCFLSITSLFVFASLTNAAELSERLSGRILLQVESHGEAWYVNPETGKRHYMGGADDAYQLMRRLGLGISNADFANFGDKAPARLAGKILLKVEDYGKAFYVDPGDLSLHYLANGADAYQLMRNLGLGIKNADLNQITVDDQSASGLPQTNEESTETNGAAAGSNIRDYYCPKLVEYEFTHPENLSGIMGGFISSGPPLLRLTRAEFQGDDMACIYENQFATSEYNNTDNVFAFYLWAAESQCPNFLGLNIRNKDYIAPGWKILYPGYVKVDKTHAGHKYVVMYLYSSADEKAFTYDGCVYSTILQEGSDPTLRKPKDGYCLVNETNDGFKCADSLAEMYSTGNTTPMLNQ